MDIASQAILDMSERCLLTVRDKRRRYDRTEACVALGALATAVIKAESDFSEANGRVPVPDKYRLRFAQAERMAWTAKAFSVWSGQEPINIW